MKKSIFLTMALFVSVLTVNAQSQFSVLDHEGTLTPYYGSAAFKSAYDAAVNGDIITLSPGSFTLTSNLTISKGITIRGAGAYYDSVARTEATIVSGSNIYINAHDTTYHLKIEGVNFGGSYDIYSDGLMNARFNKCYFNGFRNNGSTAMENCTFINCHFSYLEMGYSCSWSNNQFINSVVGSSFSCFVANPANNTFANCYLLISQQDLRYLSNLNLYNSILINNYNYNCYTVESVSSIYNCIGILSGRSFFNTTVNHSLYNLTSRAGLIKSYNANGYNHAFELADLLAAIYLGNDGTQIGPAGGSFPYNMSVHHPRLGKITPALQTRPDGKLEVDVEILNEEAPNETF